MQKFVRNKKTLSLGPKISYFGIFGLQFCEIMIIFEITFHDFAEKQSFVRNKSPSNLITKMLHLSIFRLKSGKYIVLIFEISIHEFFIMRRFMQKQKKTPQI